jgi:hypothetical protein
MIIDNGNNKKICKNIIFDPSRMSIDSFKIIIDNLYSIKNPSEYSYIVYNKSFECSRLNEMKILINENEYTIRIDEIIENIYDLADFFDAGKDSFIFNKDLKGFYSIKKILPLIEKYSQNIFDRTGCRKYSELNVKNGVDAQNLAAKRFFGLINDND